MINVNNGNVTTDEGLKIWAGYTFDDFKTSKYYKNQDGIRIIYLDEPQTIKGRKYIIGFFFKNKMIYMLSLINCDLEISYKNEKMRKYIHDELLNKEGVKKNYRYDWGIVKSEYDARSNMSSIDIYYELKK